VHDIGKKIINFPFLGSGDLFFLFSVFWSFGKLTFGILAIQEIEFGMLVSGF